MSSITQDRINAAHARSSIQLPTLHHPHPATTSFDSTPNNPILLLLNSLHNKMKSAVMAVACAAGAQAFVAPR